MLCPVCLQLEHFRLLFAGGGADDDGADECTGRDGLLLPSGSGQT